MYLVMSLNNINKNDERIFKTTALTMHAYCLLYLRSFYEFCGGVTRIHDT